MTQADAHVVVGEREGAASVEAGVRAFPQSVGGSAWRRRQRRLRNMGRFVAQSVRVALATTSHHSFDSRAGGSTVRTVDQRVSELERKLETDLVSRFAAVELLVETLQGDMSRGRSHLESSLDARLCDVSFQFDAKVSSVADSCCAISDKFESHVATLTVSCANLDAQVISLSESCRRYADDVTQESCLPLKEQLSEVQNQLSRILDWQSLFDDCVGDPDNIRQSERLVLAIFNVLSADPGVRDLLAAEDFRLAYGE